MKSASPLFSKVVNAFNAFLENRAPSEKNMIVVLFFAVFLVADYYVFLRPVLGVFTTTTPQLAADKQKLQSMEDDMANKDRIHQRWLDAQRKQASTDAQFVERAELPAILDSLSTLAQECNLKIIALKPSETTTSGPGFLRIPIRFSAAAGTHDLGKFLSRLETGSIYFKVSDLRISADPLDEHRHTVELSIETYAKT